MVVSENEKLKKFVELRSAYIELLEKGQLSKQQLNDKNSKLFINLDLRPFSNLDTFEKALFNYNYYNTKAKQALNQANKYRELNKLKKSKKEDNFKLNCYNEKDKATLAMVELENPNKIEAYYIKLHSRNLSKTIFEINFKARKHVILHSKSDQIKSLLIEKGVFFDDIRDSLIDSYVNNG